MAGLSAEDKDICWSFVKAAFEEYEELPMDIENWWMDYLDMGGRGERWWHYYLCDKSIHVEEYPDMITSADLLFYEITAQNWEIYWIRMVVFVPFSLAAGIIAFFRQDLSDLIRRSRKEILGY